MAPRVGETIQPDDLAKKAHHQILEMLRNSPKRLFLMGVLASDDAGSNQYANWTRKTCQEIGVHFHLMKLSPKNVATYIRAINANNSVHGIIVYYPIFGDKRDDEIRQLVAPSKDVEGLNHQTLHRVSDAAEVSSPPKPGRNIIPCTPRAVAWILEWMDVHDRTRPAGERLQNQEICIINRSDVVGLPLAHLLAGEGARVYSVDISGVQLFQRLYYPWHSEALHGKDLPNWSVRDAVQRSRVVISAVPDPAFKVNTKWLQRGAICVNVSSEKNFEANVVEVASKFVPRVGSVTIGALLYNLILCSSRN
ncbi:Tetrahydrofolate dehydrogenase/cyclohydrolase catalytic domain protein [Aspergillus parasiticus SU-1]|uniref:Tetrahydrofolate dehydrogenase/cyclohydrolase catalytic domain-containing protein n=2 Tax=Aspergillus parasiticus TaxID=5067 RepID=A0A5N6DQH0_ASPPA|nr:hypothetical protein BDV34DRAFT_71167 [Aspergillus parasiticus]KJK62558.1 Tetrahydrofolate dehydrogenase/cyclohydrolase catalytic domain protein [Aspergillus parasiticus SU-1]